MKQPILAVHNLSIDFISESNISPAVKNISFNVSAGEIVAIVGESGSGKSVTSLSLLQLLPKQAIVKGSLIFCRNDQQTVDLNKISEKEINAIRGKDIAMIFQEPMTSLNPVFTCGYQVMEAIQLHQQLSKAASKEKAISLFEKVKLPNPAEMTNRYPHELSGGQKQRVMIAMAISCNPSLLIADEPTTALDVTVQKTILELVKDLQLQLGMGVIFITHDLGLVADIADRVLVMYKGEIAEQGCTNDVLQNPQHPYTKALMACRPAMHVRGERLPVVSDFLPPLSFTGEPIRPEKVLTDPNDLLSNTEPETKNVKRKTNNAEIILKVENLKVYFPGKKTFFGKTSIPFMALDDICFSVSKGETVGLVGESGCGKTTLGRAILQLIPARSGNIVLNGVNLAGLSKAAMQPIRKNLQIVFQDPYGSLNPRLTIGAAIQEPMRVHAILRSNSQRKDKVMELLEKVNLKPEYFNRYPHEFSGGQRQRICIARALALNPSFLIFDESVSALDVSVQAQVLNLLNDLKKEFGFTAIFISHDLSVVRFISDRILVMNKGKVIEEGPSDEIYFSPKNEYTKKLIAAIPGKGVGNRQ
ncbi:MAG: ABC transporter ATP-binding protein [Ferruginibacter sp.]|nr:ABC transporter ATP-binding protein [Ferruginibacter sp.]